MINVTFSTTELLGFDDIAEKVNDECSSIMLMYKKYNKIAEFSDLLRDYFGAEITHEDPITISDIERFIMSNAKMELLNLITVKEIENNDITNIVILFEWLSLPSNICDFLSHIQRMGGFDTFLEIVVKYNKYYYDIDVDTKDITLNDIYLCLKEYTDFTNTFIRMKHDANIKDNTPIFCAQNSH